MGLLRLAVTASILAAMAWATVNLPTLIDQVDGAAVADRARVWVADVSDAADGLAAEMAPDPTPAEDGRDQRSTSLCDDLPLANCP